MEGGHDATVASATSEYGCIFKYELEERDEDSLVLLAPTVPLAWRSSAGEEEPADLRGRTFSTMALPTKGRLGMSARRR
jgi:hypothetical protein